MPRRTQAEKRIEPLVSDLELLEHLLLEAARAAKSARLVDVDILEQHKVRRLALFEAPVRATRTRRRRSSGPTPFS